MGQKKKLLIISLVFSPIFYLLGLLQPQAVLLDAPFGLAFYIADLSGRWQPGLLWVINHRFLAIFCGLVWPLIVSMLLCYITTSIASKIWFEGKKHSRWCAALFIIAVFGLILIVRVKPASYDVSYHGYWIVNY